MFSDEIGLFMCFILYCVLFLSSFWVARSFGLSVALFLLSSMLFVCYAVFCCSRLFIVYLSYEVSLLPIILIIIIWGSYSERSLRSIMLLLYTSIFTLPFILVLFYVFFHFGTFNFIFFDGSLSHFMSFILFGVFAVKLPIYGLHYWLPMAHVEAPTFGSMILAGVLLKLGGVGLIRCYSLIDWYWVGCFFLSYFMLFLVFVTVVCCFQSDFKRLVAYSSVSHMIVVPILFMSYTLIRFKSVVLILLFHGFSSPLLFSLVGYVYSVYSTRQLILLRGIVLFSPLLALISIAAFMFTLCVPPFPSYVAEVMFFISSVNLWIVAPLILVCFSFFSLVYNLNWLSLSIFSTCSSSVSYSRSYFSYLYFLSIVIFLMVGLVFPLLFSFV